MIEEFEEEREFCDEIDAIYISLFIMAVAYFMYFALFVDLKYGTVAVIFLAVGFSMRMILNKTQFIESKIIVGSGDPLFYAMLFSSIWMVMAYILTQFVVPASSIPREYAIAIVLVGVAEETFYNYFVFAILFTLFVRWLNDIDATFFSLLITAIFFYFIHPLSERPYLVVLMAFRIFLCITYLVSKNITVPVLVHIINNALTLWGVGI